MQLLDGVGAGIFGALFPLVVADLTRGTGRFNVSQGAIATAQGIGASLSNMVAGFIIVWAGYSAAFLFLGCVAAGAFVLYWFAMPGTRKPVSEWRKSGEGRPEAPLQLRVSVVAADGPCL